MREKKNENDNRERTKGGIVLSASVDRVEMEGKSENTAKTSEGCGREGRPLLPLLQTTTPLRTFLASFHRSCAAADVSLSLGPKICGVKSNNNRTPHSKTDMAVSKLFVFSLKKRMGKVNATL